MVFASRASWMAGNQILHQGMHSRAWHRIIWQDIIFYAGHHSRRFINMRTSHPTIRHHILKDISHSCVVSYCSILHIELHNILEKDIRIQQVGMVLVISLGIAGALKCLNLSSPKGHHIFQSKPEHAACAVHAIWLCSYAKHHRFPRKCEANTDLHWYSVETRMCLFSS